VLLSLVYQIKKQLKKIAMKTQSNVKAIDFDSIKNLVFTVQLCLVMLAFPALLVVQLTHKYRAETSTEVSNQLTDNTHKTISYSN
jgi:hypothetical protein